MTSAITGIFGFIFLIIWALLAFYTFLNILRNKGHYLNLGNKLLWIVIIIVVPIVGSLTYLFWKGIKSPSL